MIRASFLDDVTLAQLESAGRRLTESDVADGLQLVGVQLLSDIKLDFEEKSRGGVGEDGKGWMPLKDSTIKKKNRRGKTKKARASMESQINVDTGMLRSSATPGFQGNVLDVDAAGLSVTVGYGMEYAKYVDELRTLIPEELPLAWVEECELVLEEWAQGLADEEMD